MFTEFQFTLFRGSLEVHYDEIHISTFVNHIVELDLLSVHPIMIRFFQPPTNGSSRL